MSLILNQSQAEAVYSAMCALNNVGGIFDAKFKKYVGERIGVIVVQAAWDGEVFIKFDVFEMAQQSELYIDQSAFAEAYGLNSAEPQNAIASRGVQ